MNITVNSDRRNLVSTLLKSQSNHKLVSLCKQKHLKDRLGSFGLSNYEIISSHVGPVQIVSIETGDCRYLLSGGSDGVLALYDLSTALHSGSQMSLKHDIRSSSTLSHKRPITATEWFPQDAGAFVSSSVDGTVKIWDTNYFEPVGRFDLCNPVNSASMNREGSLIATGLPDSCVRLCDPNTGGSIQTLTGHTKSVTRVVWSPLSSHTLASSSSGELN